MRGLFRHVLILAALAAVAPFGPAHAQEFVAFASPPFIWGAGDGGRNATCYFSNVGSRSVRMKSIRIFEAGGFVKPLVANSCGGVDGVRLAPGASCFVRTNTATSTTACAALVDDGASIRGTLEFRAPDSSVNSRARLSVGAGGTSGSEFETLASPAMWAAPDARFLLCFVTNVGSKPARVRDARMATSTGAPVAISRDRCSGETLGPGETCHFEGDVANPRTDRQCLVSVTRKANIRGSLNMSGVWAPME